MCVLASCTGTFSPVRGKLEPGQDRYIVFAADGPGGNADLFAARADNGAVTPLTFGAADESIPALSPDGAVVAFLRSGRAGGPRIWLLNLINGAEREIPLPKKDGPTAIARLGWSRDGRTLYVGAGAEAWRTPVPPAPVSLSPVPTDARAISDSAVTVLLGDPPFARVVRCDDPRDLCVLPDSGGPGLLAREAGDAARWGPDSVGYFVGTELEIRPLGPGRARRLTLRPPPVRPRAPTFFEPARQRQR